MPPHSAPPASLEQVVVVCRTFVRHLKQLRGGTASERKTHQDSFGCYSKLGEGTSERRRLHSHFGSAAAPASTRRVVAASPFPGGAGLHPRCCRGPVGLEALGLWSGVAGIASFCRTFVRHLKQLRGGTASERKTHQDSFGCLIIYQTSNLTLDPTPLQTQTFDPSTHLPP